MPTSDYSPSLAQVARRNMQRTKDQFGNLVGTFSSVTVPTDTQVTALIAEIVNEVADLIGDDIPDSCFENGQNVCAIKTAAQIELDYFSDQVNTGRSIYPQLLAQYEMAVKRLMRQVTIVSEGDGSTVKSADASMRPSYNFGQDCCEVEPGQSRGMIGFGTRW